MGSSWGEAPLLKLENTPSPLHLLADSQFLYLLIWFSAGLGTEPMERLPKLGKHWTQQPGHYPANLQRWPYTPQ